MPTIPTWEETTALETAPTTASEPSWDDTEPAPEIIEAPPGSLKNSYFAPEQGTGFWTTPVTGAPNLVREPKTIPEGLYNTVAKGLGAILSPLGLATAPVAAAKPLQPIVAGVLGGLGAKQAGTIAGQQLAGPTIAGVIPTPTPGLTPGERTEAAGDIAQNLLMGAAPLLHTLPKATTQTLETLKERIPDATQERIVQESSQSEHIGTEAQRETAETGGGDRPVGSETVSPQETQVGVTPEVPLSRERVKTAALELGDGRILTGSAHPVILSTLPEGTPIKSEGFLTTKGRYVSREEGAKLEGWTDADIKMVEPTMEDIKAERENRGEPRNLPSETVTKETPSPEPAIEQPKVGEQSPVEGGLSVGPGAASPGDVPASPREAAIAVEQANPSQRPMGPMTPLSQTFHNVRQGISTMLKGLAGESMPKTTAADRTVGEAGVRYASSRIAARPMAETFATHALEGTDVDPVKFGAALTEDNLDSIRESLRAKQTERLAAGDEEGAAKAQADADNVATIIGVKGSPFKTWEEYQDFLQEPNTKKALQQHIQLWSDEIDPQYKQAQGIDPEVELPTRGQQTGARINLKVIFPEETLEAGKPVKAGAGGPSLTATFKRKSPFGIKAKGSGKIYDINYNDIIANTFERQLETANKNAFDKALVDSGNAVIDEPAMQRQITLKGEPVVAFPLVRKTIVTPGSKPIPVSKNLYIRKSLADEYRTASNVDPRYNLKVVTPVMNVLNKAALAGLTDFTVHGSNLLTALFNRPTSGKLLTDTLLSLTGRADVPVTLVKTLIKSFQKNKAQAAELAEIGAARPDVKQNVAGRVLKSLDKTTRSVLDDTFKGLADAGLVENTETNRREYANQVGQYNRRLQGVITRFLRDTGFGPFVTAGKTFNTLGVKMLSLSPGAKATSPMAAAALRANVLSKFIGTAVLVGTLNYLFTKKIGGREGTPLGDVDFGTDDKTGKHQSLPVASLLGLGRGLRVTGLKGAIQAKRLGLSNADAFDAAARDIFNSWVAPGAGPGPRAVMVGATGYPTAYHVGRASRVAPPGSSQVAENVLEAARQANPFIQSYLKYREGKPLSEALASQLPRFSMQPGKSEQTAKNYPRIVTMARANEFVEDVIGQARKMPLNERGKFLTEQMNRLPPELRGKAWKEFERRKLFQ